MDNGYFVYVLYSKVHDRYYAGSSADPQKRLQSHNDPRNKSWTKRYAPWELIYIDLKNYNSRILIFLNQTGYP